ncbi:MAG: ribonuclease P protein component [Epulopiscium sp. Nele67-Bin004]|nr:MAG: ribonuclease P protein component [Epulopiscium sp. Nele67-Bin004]
MKHTESLKKRNEFSKVYKKGKSFANKYLVVYTLANNYDINRLGITVSKKVGNSVVRSRVTRLIRENYRLREDQILNTGKDIIIIARSSAQEASYIDISNSLEKLLKQHRLWE